MLGPVWSSITVMSATELTSVVDDILARSLDTVSSFCYVISPIITRNIDTLIDID